MEKREDIHHSYHATCSQGGMPCQSIPYQRECQKWILNSTLFLKDICFRWKFCGYILSFSFHREFSLRSKINLFYFWIWFLPKIALCIEIQSPKAAVWPCQVLKNSLARVSTQSPASLRHFFFTGLSKILDFCQNNFPLIDVRFSASSWAESFRQSRTLLVPRPRNG